MRWWIVEDALRDRKGHWFEYLRTFQSGLAAESDQVRFFASRECSPEVIAAFGAEPVLPKSIWARMSDGASKWRRLLRIPAHGLATYRAFSRLLTDCAAPRAPSSKPSTDRVLPDLIFVPTTLVHHLAGWIPLIKWRLRKLPCRVLLFFPNAPVDLRENGSACLAPDPTAKLFALCIRALAKEVAAGKVILGAETKPMTKALSEITRVPFTYLPHPVEMSGLSSRVNRHMPMAPEENPIVFGSYGAARHEKGSDILQRAIREVLVNNPEVPARFVFQWTEDFADEHGRTIVLDPWLRDHPKVQVMQSIFPRGGYEKQVAHTDVMILPYRKPYRVRVSRVVIEAMSVGMPVIATRGTTLSDQANEFGVARACEEGSANDLAKAILSVIQNFEELRIAAQAKKEVSRSHFSVAEFRQRILAVNN
jgi:glycosyltransferase involved in cell wall biosynthesis